MRARARTPQPCTLRRLTARRSRPSGSAARAAQSRPVGPMFRFVNRYAFGPSATWLEPPQRMIALLVSVRPHAAGKRRTKCERLHDNPTEIHAPRAECRIWRGCSGPRRRTCAGHLPPPVGQRLQIRWRVAPYPRRTTTPLSHRSGGDFAESDLAESDLAYAGERHAFRKYDGVPACAGTRSKAPD